jgi:hypothetical protein
MCLVVTIATFFAASKPSKHNYDVHITADILIKEQECMTSLLTQDNRLTMKSRI